MFLEVDDADAIDKIEAELVAVEARIDGRNAALANLSAPALLAAALALAPASHAYLVKQANTSAAAPTQDATALYARAWAALNKPLEVSKALKPWLQNPHTQESAQRATQALLGE